MTTKPQPEPPGLLDGIARIHELMSSHGVSWEAARELLERDLIGEAEDASNIVNLNDYRKVH